MVSIISQDDIVLDVLLTQRKEQQAPISEKLVREVYEVQRTHQFESERDAVVLGVKKAVEAEVDEEDQP